MLQEINSREYERKLQLLPGSLEREAALTESLEELKEQLDKANKESAEKARTTKILLFSTILAVGGLFLTNSKVSPYLKTLGILLSIGSLVKAASSANFVQEVPKTTDFSAQDRAYNYLYENGLTQKGLLVRLIVWACLDVMIALKLVKMNDIAAKQKLLFNNLLDTNQMIKDGIVSYGKR